MDLSSLITLVTIVFSVLKITRGLTVFRKISKSYSSEKLAPGPWASCFFVFANIGPYGIKNVKRLLFPQMAFVFF